METSRIARFIDRKLSAAGAVVVMLLALVLNGSLLFAQYTPPSGFEAQTPDFDVVPGAEGLLGTVLWGLVPNGDAGAGDGPSTPLPSRSDAEASSGAEEAASGTLAADDAASGRGGDSETIGPGPQLASVPTPVPETVSNPSSPTGASTAPQNTVPLGSVPSTVPTPLGQSASPTSLPSLALAQSSGAPPVAPVSPVPSLEAPQPGALQEPALPPALLPGTPLEQPLPSVPPEPLPGVPAVPGLLEQPVLQEPNPTALPDPFQNPALPALPQDAVPRDPIPGDLPGDGRGKGGDGEGPGDLPGDGRGKGGGDEGKGGGGKGGNGPKLPQLP